MRHEAGFVELGHLTLEWVPIWPGTLVGLVGYTNLHDDGNGNVIDVRGAPKGTINYLTGEISLPHHVNELPYIFDYRFDSMSPRRIEHVQHLVVVQTPIVARPRRLTQQWTAEFA